MKYFNSDSVSAASTEGALEFQASVIPTIINLKKNDVAVLHTYAAKRIIQDLEDGRSYFHVGLPFHTLLEGKKRSNALINQESIVGSVKYFAKNYGLKTGVTSMVPVDAFGEMLDPKKVSLQWLAKPSRFANLKIATQSKTETSGASSKKSPSRSLFGFAKSKINSTTSIPENSGGITAFDKTSNYESLSKGSQSRQESANGFDVISTKDNISVSITEYTPVPTNDPHSILSVIVDKVAFDGSVNWSDDLAFTLAAVPLTKKAQGEITSRPDVLESLKKVSKLKYEKVFATLAVLTYIQVHLSDYAPAFEVVKKQSLNWLQTNGNVDVTEGMDEIKKLIQ